MKKNILSIILVFIFILTTGCANYSEIITDNPNDNIVIKEYKPNGAFGESEYESIIINTITYNDQYNAKINELANNIQKNIPIYINQYPFGQEGPLFDITDKEQEMLKNKLNYFLTVLYNANNITEYEIKIDPERPYRAEYVKDDNEISSSFANITLYTNEQPKISQQQKALLQAHIQNNFTAIT